MKRAYILADEDIDAPHVPIPRRACPSAHDATLQIAIGTRIAEVERRMILATLAELDGDKERTAKTLGISLKTLYNKLKRYRAET